MISLNVLLLLVLKTVLVSGSEIITCEGNSLNISCPNGQVISIGSANYGRTEKTICPSSSDQNLTCHAQNSLPIVSSKCNGQQNCVVGANNQVFGDPCVNTYKYLDVNYTCIIPEPSGSEVIACEGKSLNISCPKGEVISIISANYGRTEKNICPSSSDKNLTCHAKDSKLIVSSKCNDKQTCVVAANNQVFGDPCVNTYKYLDVNYTCITPDPSSTTALTCEGSTLNISCSNGLVINIFSANYGRTNSSICVSGSVSNTNCSASNATSILASKCQDQSNCSIGANNNVFTDPCVGTYKYLEVNYSCVAPNTRNCGQNEEPGCVNRCNKVCPYTGYNPPKVCSFLCMFGCVCKTGFIRDTRSGMCVGKDYCPLSGSYCFTHEIYSDCGAGCQATCDNPQPGNCTTCVPGYICDNGYVRNTKTGLCAKLIPCGGC